MKIEYLEIPEDDFERAAWLEQKIFASDLEDFVAHLRQVNKISHDADSVDQSIEEFLSDYRDDVFEQGLVSVPPDRIKILFQQPNLLLELRSSVVEFGGEHWVEIANSSHFKDLADNQWSAIENAISTRPPAATVSPSSLSQRSSDARKASGYSFASVLTSALAASLLFFLVGYFAGNSNDQVQIVNLKELGVVAVDDDWGFSRVGILATPLPRKDKLTHISNLIAEWRLERPSNATELMTRAAEFRKSCDTFLNSELVGLPESDSKWLYAKCAHWRSEIDKQLGVLAATQDFEGVLAALDQLTDNAIQTIRERI